MQVFLKHKLKIDRKMMIVLHDFLLEKRSHQHTPDPALVLVLEVSLDHRCKKQPKRFQDAA